jgi:hypothetical protein
VCTPMSRGGVPSRICSLKAPLSYALASSNHSALFSINMTLPLLGAVPFLVSIELLAHLQGEVLDELKDTAHILSFCSSI